MGLTSSFLLTSSSARRTAYFAFSRAVWSSAGTQSSFPPAPGLEEMLLVLSADLSQKFAIPSVSDLSGPVAAPVAIPWRSKPLLHCDAILPRRSLQTSSRAGRRQQFCLPSGIGRNWESRYHPRRGPLPRGQPLPFLVQAAHHCSPRQPQR